MTGILGRAAAAFAVLAAGGCGVPAMIEGDQVIYTAQATTDVERTAACLYTALEKVHGSRTSKVDLPTEGKAYVDVNGDGSRYFRLILTKASGGRTNVEAVALRISAPGLGLNDEKLYSPIKKCVV